MDSARRISTKTDSDQVYWGRCIQRSRLPCREGRALPAHRDHINALNVHEDHRKASTVHGDHRKARSIFKYTVQKWIPHDEIPEVQKSDQSNSSQSSQQSHST